MNLFHSRVELYDSVLAVLNVWGSNSKDLKIKNPAIPSQIVNKVSNFYVKPRRRYEVIKR